MAEDLLPGRTLISAARPARSLIALVTLAVATLLAQTSAQAQDKTLRVVPQSNITILDPIWTTAYVTRNHGYMIYDTLFGTDADSKIKPQMVDKWNVSKDQLTWTFHLRDGLEFHDGKPVTSEDVVASLKRWASRDGLGGIMNLSLQAYGTPDARTFVVKLKQPFGAMLEALGKPSSNVAFIMPARIASTPGSEQIKEQVGSGPYKFVAAEYRPGEKLVYLKNDKYKPRDEPPSGTAGGKQVYLDRVEWIILRDPQTQFNALVTGEVDILEQPTFEQYTSLKAAKDVKLVDAQPAGLQYIFRFNHLQVPFDNVKIRQAAMVALGQEAILKTQVGVPGMYRLCKSVFPCGTPYASDNTDFFTGTANPKKAAQMLKEAGYNGQPVVLLRPTDLASISKLPLVAKQQLEAAGFKVDLQNMDWATLLARRTKKDAPDKGGWSAFMSTGTASDFRNPLSMIMLNASGDKGWFGWQDDKVIEDLKARFAQASSDPEKKKLAEQLQLRAIETASHVPLGQYNNPAALRTNITGLVPGGAQVYWNLKKN